MQYSVPCTPCRVVSFRSKKFGHNLPTPCRQPCLPLCRPPCLPLYQPPWPPPWSMDVHLHLHLHVGHHEAHRVHDHMRMSKIGAWSSLSRTEWPGTNYVLLRSSHFHICPHSSWSLAGWLVTQFQMSRKLWSRRRRSNYPRKKCPNHLPSLLPYIIGFDAIYFWYPDTSGKLCFSFFLLAIKKLKLFTLVNRLS